MKNYHLCKAMVLSGTLVFFSVTTCRSQSLPRWSSFYENGFIWNPALTAQWYNWEASITHRQEWSGFENAPQYSTIAFQLPVSDQFFKTQASFGGFLQRDKIGPFHIMGIAGTYSYKITPQLFGNKKDMLAFGVLFNVNYQDIDMNALTAFDGLDGENVNIESGVRPDIAIGLFYRSNGYLFRHKKHFFWGFSLNKLVPLKLASYKISDFRNNAHATLHGGYRLFPGRKWFVEPNVMLIYGYQKAMDVMLSMRMEFLNSLWIGVGASTTEEVFGQVGFIMGGRSALGNLIGDGSLRIGVKADYDMGSMRNYSGIGYEFYMAYQYDIE